MSDVMCEEDNVLKLVPLIFRKSNIKCSLISALASKNLSNENNNGTLSY